jgi:predicted helicase
MYAQTVAYGLLSARIADPVAATNHRDRAMPVTNVFLKELMDTFLNGDSRQAVPGRCAIDFDELGIADVVKLLDSANMEAVVVDFGDRNPQEDPVIHFYELFLSEYDAEKRLQRGVFYTPRPVVSFIVRSVDQMLRTRFGLDCGLADTSTWAQVVARNPELTIPQGTSPDEPFVKVLDPATGTGTFLVEVIEVIHSTMIGKWTVAGRSESEVQELWNQYVSDDLLPRLYGYELLMAPYAIAHLKIGLKLHESGYDFRGGERVRVYLTNALEPTQDFSDRLSFAVPALAHEAHSVNEVKTSTRFTVVVGNPPYSKASQNQNAWIELLMEDYKRTVRSAETQIQALSDDYAKFIRLLTSPEVVYKGPAA